MTNTVLIVASHPDDEVLGVGGTAAWHAARGDRVVTMIMAEGATSRDVMRNAEARNTEITELKEAAVAAAAILGLDSPRFGGLPDNRMDSLDLLDVIKLVEDLVTEVDPDIIYTHHGSDLNVDHRVTHQAVLTACRPLPGLRPRAIYTFETVSSTEWASDDTGPAFRPQLYVDISSTLARKLDALARYRMEMRPFPHARSIPAVEALAKWRGSQIGREAAEAFMVVRHVLNSQERT